jgi:hypothetical protein
MTDPQSLPVELPPPVGWVHHSGQLQEDRERGYPVYDEDALLSYATACVLAEREAICKMIDDMDGHTGGHGGGQRPRADEVIDAIRARR